MGASSRRPRLRLISAPGLEAEPQVPESPARDVGADPADSPPDDVLVARARQAEGSAFEALYRRHAGFAFNLAARIQGSSTDIEDVVHDAFVRAQERLMELRDAAAFRPWLGSIVVRLVRTRLRRRRLLGALGLSAPEPVDIETIAAVDADPEARALLAQVYALLQTMSADERIAWTLRYVELHRLETVAVMMDCSLATAKRRVARAQRFLTDHFVTPFVRSA